MTKYTKAVFELFIAGIIWGASFTLVLWVLEDFSTSTLIFWRFIFAFVLGESLQYTFFQQDYKKSHSDMRRSARAGFFLALSLIFQTQGLLTTTATNSGFISSLYVIFVPIVGGLFYRHKIKTFHFILGFVSFVGMGLLLQIHNFSQFKINGGDLLTLGCAVSAAFHIITVGQKAPSVVSAFRFNNYQNLWTLVVILPFLIYETTQKKIPLWPDHVGFKSIFSLISLSVFVSLIAFFLQIRSQKVLNTTTSSLLCLLEAPNAFLFAAVFLDEKMNLIQIVGVLMILVSSAFSVYIDRPQN